MKTLGRFPKALLVVALLPLLVAGVGIWALKDRASGFENVPAAVVNLDEGTEMEVDGKTQTVPFGRLFAGALTQPGTVEREGSDGSSVDLDSAGFDWQLTTQKDAESGLKDGSYAAVVVIPKDFSQNLGTMGTTDARQATVIVNTNDSSGMLDSMVGQAITQVVASEFNGTMAKQYLDGMYVGFNSLKDGFTKSADGAGELSDGAHELADGAKGLDDGAGKLATGIDELSGGVVSLDNGAGELANGVRGLDQGTTKLSDGASTLAGGTGALATGTGELAGVHATSLTGSVRSPMARIRSRAGSPSFPTESTEPMRSQDCGKAPTNLPQVSTATEARKTQVSFRGRSNCPTVWTSTPRDCPKPRKVSRGDSRTASIKHSTLGAMANRALRNH